MFASDLIGRTILAAADDYHDRMLLRLDNGVVIQIEVESDEDGSELVLSEFEPSRDWAAWPDNDLKVVLNPEDYAKAKQRRDEKAATMMAEAEKEERALYEMLKQKFGGVE